MGERKVLNKYIPADFDPSLIPRGKKLSSKDGTVPVRMMLPFSIQCSTCGTFLYRGRKFNSKKEPMGGPNGTYLGITRFRFYIKCTSCARPLTILTDPKNADYEMESGGTRNYEVYKDQAATEEAVAVDKIENEKLDPMKALENRVLESQREMADLDNLEEIKALNAKHSKLTIEEIINKRKKLRLEAVDDDSTTNNNDTNELFLTAEDEEYIKSIQFGRNDQQQSSSTQRRTENGEFIGRLDEDDEIAFEKKRLLQLQQLENQFAASSKPTTTKSSNNNNKPPNTNNPNEYNQSLLSSSLSSSKTTTLPLIMIKKRRIEDNPNATTNKPIGTFDSISHHSIEQIGKQHDESSDKNIPLLSDKNIPSVGTSTNGGGLSSLVGDYGSSSDSDSD